MPLRPRVGILFGALALFPALHASPPLRVGIDVDGEPMTFVDDKGVPQGFAVELVNAVGRAMHVSVVYVPKPWGEMLADFQAGRTDVLANITSTRQREGVIAFSDPHVVMEGAIFIRRGDTRVRSVVDLADLRVSVKRGGAPYEYLQDHGWLRHLVPGPSLRDSLRQIAEGRADATLDARIIGLKEIRDEHLANVEASEVRLHDFAQRLHFGLHPGQPEMVALFNEGLARVRASGEYDRIYERWLGPLEPRRLRFKDVAPYLPLIGVVLSGAAAALIWQRRILRRLKLQARALQESEERLTLVLEGSEDGFWDFDVTTGRVERSRRWASMLGYSLEDVPAVFERARDLVHPDDLAAYDACDVEIQSGRTSRFDLQFRMKAKSGEWRWILRRGKVVLRDAAGRPARMAGTHTDITDLKRAEQEREQLRLKMLETQKLESLGLLAGGIAHDFNNLLTVILAHAALARAAPGAGDSLEQIEAAARRAADLCRQMLAYSGRGSFVIEQFDLNALVRDTVHLLKVSISKKATLTLDLASGRAPVEADGSQLQQIVMNLVINASEALGEGAGEIRLRTGGGRPEEAPAMATHVFDLPPGECVWLEIADTGAGMDAATLGRIFDPFFTTKFTGRGLGLAAVLGIVRARHGALTVSSTAGAGTTFRVYFPRARGRAAEPAEAAPAAAVPEGKGKGLILVADDEAAVRRTIDRILRGAGYQTFLAADGVEALREFRAAGAAFTALVLDLTMPGLDGAEVLREARALDPGVRVLVTSGYTDQDVLERFAGLGPVAILHKPFTPQALVSRLAEVIGGR